MALKKTFSKVLHQKSLQKINGLYLRGGMLVWLKDWLLAGNKRLDKCTSLFSGWQEARYHDPHWY